MNVSCPQCSTTYRVDPAKVPLGGVRARCSACSGVIPVGIAETVARSTPVSTPIRERYVTPPRPAPVATPPRPMTPPRERPMTPPRSAALPPLRPTPRTPWPSVATPSAPAAPVPPQAARPFIPSQTPISVPAYTPPPPPPRVIPQPPVPPAPVAESSPAPTPIPNFDPSSFTSPFVAPPTAMLLASIIYRFRRGAHRVFCAKLHHCNNQRCIFNCRYGDLHAK